MTRCRCGWRYRWADETSGCMRMVPGSHRAGRRDHRNTSDSANVLYQGQTVEDVDESRSVVCALRPGEASFHHGWTLHASSPNCSDDRRIGFNAQYVATHMRQTQHSRDTAMLVCGPMRSTTSAWTSPHPETCNPAHLRGSANSTAWSA